MIAADQIRNVSKGMKNHSTLDYNNSWSVDILQPPNYLFKKPVRHLQEQQAGGLSECLSECTNKSKPAEYSSKPSLRVHAVCAPGLIECIDNTSVS